MENTKRTGQEMKFRGIDLRKVDLNVADVIPYYFEMTEEQKYILRHRLIANIYIQFKMDVDDVIEMLPMHKNPFDDPDFMDEWIEHHENALYYEDYERCQILDDAFNDYSGQMD